MDLVEDMLSYKESLGYSRESYKGYLTDFVSFVQKHGGKGFLFSEERYQNGVR
jgi:hypothetical protein